MWTRWPGYLRWYITYNWVIVCYLLPITPKQHLIFNATEIAPIIYVSVSCNIPQNISNKKNAKPKSSCLVDLWIVLSLPTRNFHEFPATLEGKSHISEFPCYSKTSTEIYQPSKTDHGPTAAEFGNFLALPRRDLVAFVASSLWCLWGLQPAFFTDSLRVDFCYKWDAGAKSMFIHNYKCFPNIFWMFFNS